MAVITSKYIIGYGLGAAGNASVIPFIDAFGIGWWSTLSKIFLSITRRVVWLIFVIHSVGTGDMCRWLYIHARQIWASIKETTTYLRNIA